MPPWSDGALSLPHTLNNAKIINCKNVMFNDDEAIVPITEALPQ
jgi:hypothetical protein